MTNRVRISVGSDPEELELVDTVVESFCVKRTLAAEECRELRDLVGTLGKWLIGRAYPDDPTGEIVVQLELGEGEVRVTFEDWGEPITSFGGVSAPTPTELDDVAKRTTDLRLVNLGRDGKRLSFAMAAKDAKPANLASYGAMMREADTGVHSADDVVVRDGNPDDAEAISRLLFANYGLGYGHPEFYRPLWVIEQMESGALASTVALVGGEIVGHHALMITPGESSAESGVAVVHPACRGLGVFNKMFEHTEARAQTLGLQAVYGRAVTNHIYSQKSEISHGYVPTALMLGSVPVKGRTDQTKRGATLVAFLPIGRHPRAVSLPSRYADHIKGGYAQLGLEMADPKPGVGAEELGDRPSVVVNSDDERNSSTITVHRFDDAGRLQLIEALRHVVHRHDDVAWCDLDLHSMSAGELDAAVMVLREYDFFFSGLMPFGPAGHDRLRLQALLTDDAELEDIQLAADFSKLLHSWVFADHKLVNND